MFVHYLQSWRSLLGSKTKATTTLDLYLHLFVCFSSGSSGSSCFFCFCFPFFLRFLPFRLCLLLPPGILCFFFPFPSPFLFLSSLSSASLRSPPVYLSFRSFQKISHPLFLSPYATQFSFMSPSVSFYSPYSPPFLFFFFPVFLRPWCFIIFLWLL